MTGAVIGEMIGAKAGLGYLLTLGSETYDIKMILNAVILFKCDRSGALPDLGADREEGALLESDR